ncbi:hypothetical protein BGZ68_009859 [Mortierella alpina]|nr:hypothetical protein BGZ68_009859 [Mortierella alpina]
MKASQCNQPYIDNYAACQCRRSTTDFYEHAKNVGGLIRRCGGNGLTNPFGDPGQYRPGQGTATFSATGTVSPTASGFVPVTGSPSGTPFPFPVVPIPRNPGTNATRVYNGTTYYGGQTTNISGTTRIVNATAIVNAPDDEPLNVNAQSTHISGGAIAGIVLGLLGAALLAGLLALCWRKKCAAHVAPAGTTHISHAPTRTVVTEKIEPVVVKSVPANQTAHGAMVPDANAASSSYVANTGGYNTQPRR